MYIFTVYNKYLFNGNPCVHMQCCVADPKHLFNLLSDYDDSDKYTTQVSADGGVIKDLYSYFGWGQFYAYMYQYD